MRGNLKFRKIMKIHFFPIFLAALSSSRSLVSISLINKNSWKHIFTNKILFLFRHKKCHHLSLAVLIYICIEEKYPLHIVSDCRLVTIGCTIGQCNCLSYPEVESERHLNSFVLHFSTTLVVSNYFPSYCELAREIWGIFIVLQNKLL